MALENFRMLINELLNKDLDIFTEEYTLVVFDGKSAMSMAKNGKDTKHTRHIERRMYFVSNEEKCKMHKIYWCGGGLKLSEISTKNVGDHYLNRRMKYIMIRLEN